MEIRLRLAPILTALCLALPASAQEAGLRLLDHGVICQVVSEGTIAAPQTEQGRLNLIAQDRDIDVTTTLVPAELGISFGIRFISEGGGAPQPVSVVLTHPPMGPRGVTRQSWVTVLHPDDPGLALFTFEFPYEMVTGRWTLALEGEGVRLAEQGFDVVPAEAAATVLAACPGPVPMS